MKKIVWNSPVVLSFAFISLGVLLSGYATNGTSTQLLFTCYRSRFSDPLFYVRLFTHVLGHANFEHYLSNMMIFLLIGPILEEKYGSEKILKIMIITALVTGIVHVIFFPDTVLLGASGIVFAFIILVSFTGNEKGTIPLTFLLIAGLYVGDQVMSLFAADNISHLTHILGGVIGAFYGLKGK